MKALVILLLLVTTVGAESIPKRAQPWLPVLDAAIDTAWPKCPMPWIPPAQVEQESSWKQKAELKTSREYGFGFTQITITNRFNNFVEAKRVTKMNIPWEDRFDAKFQFTYLAKMNKSNFEISKKFFDDDTSCMKGMLICYNAGSGTLFHRRAISKARTWDGGLANVHAVYEERLLYGRPLWKARNEYPQLIFHKSQKYKWRYKDGDHN